MAEFIYNLNFIGVPSDFIENVMPKANGAFVKVYLYALNLAQKGIRCDYGEIADKLDLLESDVVKAFEYLSEQGCLCAFGDQIIFGKPRPVEEEPGNEPAPAEKPKKSAESIKYIMTENQNLSDLCQLAQQMLGKTLSDRDIETLYWLYDELGFSPEVILMILEYCVSKDKRSMKYIEKVAIGWHENGITTISAAEQYMHDQAEKNSYFGNIRRLFGIDDRSLSKTEEMYLKSWRDSYNMSEDMVALAYEYCIIRTNKLSFPYINSIIENWYKKGIFTVPDAEKEQEEFRNNPRSEKELNVYKDETGYDYDKIEEIMQQKYDK